MSAPCHLTLDDLLDFANRARLDGAEALANEAMAELRRRADAGDDRPSREPRFLPSEPPAGDEDGS